MRRDDRLALELPQELDEWLADAYLPASPRNLDAVVKRTRTMRQRPAWASLERWLPMTTTLRDPALPVPMRRLSIALALMLALLIALTSLPFLAGALLSPAPEGTASSGLIAFDRDGDIYVVDPPDGEPRLLVGGPDQDVGPYWSPDGRHLFFWRIAEDGELPMLTDELGTTPIPLLDKPLVNATWVHWAPDSSALIVSSDLERIDAPGETAPMLSIVPADSSGDVQELKNRPGAGADLPTWRPGTDGTIELLYRRIGDPAELHYSQIREEGASSMVVLTVDDIEGQRDDRNQGLYDFDGATWSPDGERFVYQTLHDLESNPTDPGMRVHVTTFDDGTIPAGQDDRMLEFDPQAQDELFPAWSPDGSRIAFVSKDGPTSRLVIMPAPVAVAGSTDHEVIATTLLPTGDPLRLKFDWAPDGSSLILVNTFLGTGDNAYLVDATTGELESLRWRADDWPSWQRGTSR